MKAEIIKKLGLLIKITQSTRKFIVNMDEKDPLFEQKVATVMAEYNEKCGKIARGEDL